MICMCIGLNQRLVVKITDPNTSANVVCPPWRVQPSTLPPLLLNAKNLRNVPTNYLYCTLEVVPLPDSFAMLHRVPALTYGFVPVL
jgi:hypothetical protein